MPSQFDSASWSAADLKQRAPAAVPANRARNQAPRVTRADIAAALSYINRYACDGLSVERVVKETQRVPQPLFTREFRAVTGQTVREAIRQRQLEEVRRLLTRTELSPDFIAEHCGFRDATAAARAFKTATGQVPRAFRSTANRPESAASQQPSERPYPPKGAPARNNNRPRITEVNTLTRA